MPNRLPTPERDPAAGASGWLVVEVVDVSAASAAVAGVVVELSGAAVVEGASVLVVADDASLGSPVVGVPEGASVLDTSARDEPKSSKDSDCVFICATL